ncbi:hypothetical protein RvY_04411 [Ramazzottius varieornatus]|uniref:Uncharacterized protein n=1 Tax=Ramazzottius varieornatus TaxID=947166 RepID=A0A1D1UV38_RAMVA|nr:hypothetical protein RvY_04411 [Ramazzottius varieornatus]
MASPAGRSSGMKLANEIPYVYDPPSSLSPTQALGERGALDFFVSDARHSKVPYVGPPSKFKSDPINWARATQRYPS